MKKTTLRQAALRLALVALAVLAPLGLRAQTLFSEDFEGGSMPTGWTTDGNGTWSVNTGDYNSSTGAGQGSYNAMITHGTTGDATKLITPEIDLSGATSAVLSFMHVQRSWAGDIDELRVYYRASSSDSWTQLDGQVYTNAVASWTTEVDIVLPNLSSTYQIAFEHTDNYGYGVGIDYIIIEQGASCVKPSGLAATLTPGNGTIATLNWTAGATETNWVVEYSTASDFSDATTVTTGFTTSGTNVSVNLTGLTAETPYYARVKADCGGGDESDWSMGISFTPTNAFTLTVNDGNATNEYVPFYGYYADATQQNQMIIPAADLAAMTGGEITQMVFYIDNYSLVTSIGNWIVSLGETSATTLDGLDNTTTLTEVYSGAMTFDNASDPTIMTVTITDGYVYTGGNLLVQFNHPVTAGYSHYFFTGVNATGASYCYGYQRNFLPKITFSFAPGSTSCPRPTGLAVDNTSVTAHTATISWTLGDAESQWEICFDGDETNLTTVTSSDVTISGTTVTYPLTGLTQDHTYYVKVRAYCDATEQSNWSNVVNITTPVACPAPTDLTATDITADGATLGWTSTASNFNVRYRTAALPNTLFFDDFENGLSQWTIIRNGEGTEYTDWRQFDGNFTGTPVTPHSGTYMVMSRSWSSDAYNVDNWLITPQVTLDGTLRFWVMDDGQYHDHYAVYVSTTGNTIADFGDTPFYEPGDASGTWTEITVDLSSFAGAQGYIALRHTENNQDYLLVDDFGIYGDPTPAGAWTTTTASTNSLPVTGLDEQTTYDFEVQADCGGDEESNWVASTFTTLPSCMPVSSLAIADATTTTIDLTWTDQNNGAATYVVTDGDDNAYTVTNLNTTGCTVTGLTANTAYTFKVKANCGGGFSSAEMVEGRTACDAITTLPYEESFEGDDFYCWTLDGFNRLDNTNYANYGNNSIYANNNTEPAYVILPATASSISGLMLNFWWTNYNSGYNLGSLEVGYLTDVADYNTFVTVGIINMSNSIDVYEQSNDYVFTGAPDGARMALKYSAGTSGSLVIIDDVTIDNVPSCMRPYGLTVSNETAHGATFEWVENATATAWQLYISENSTDPADDIATTDVIAANETPFTLTTGLDPETEYHVWVRANCGSADGYSTWVGPETFTTGIACPAPTDLAVTPNGQNATFTWNKGTASEWQVAFSDDNTVNPDDNIVATVTEATHSESGLALGDHYFWVRSVCGGTDGNSAWAGPVSVYIGYCTPNPTSHDGSGITGVSFGTGTDVVNNGDGSASLPASSPYYGDYTSMIGAVQAGVESTIAITTGTGSYPYTFVIWVDLDNSMTFEDDEVLYVGKAASGNGTLNATITIPATQALGDYRMRIYGADSYFTSFYNNGTTNWSADHDPCAEGTWRHAHDYTLRVLAAPSCMPAGNVTVDPANITANSAVITWTNNNGASATYTVKQGTTVLTTTAVDSYTLGGLTAATTYPAGTYTIVSNCDETAVANVPAFNTECDAITTFPWSEDFESYASGNFSGLCWVNEHIAGSSTSNVFKVYTYTNGTNNTHQLQLPDQSSGNMIKLVLPAMTLPNSNYQFILDVYRSNNTYSPSDNPYEGIRIFASTNGEIEGATELAFIPRQYNEANGNIQAESEAGWYTYNLPINMSGTCYIILRGESRYCTSTYMDNFMVTSCLPVGTLSAASNITSASAQLTWALLDNSQTAWQVAYKTATDADFTYVDANIHTNFLLDGLDPETEYTVKVRAKCSGTEFSTWSNTITFTTTPSCPKPSDLTATSITHNSATIGWDAHGETAWSMEYSEDNGANWTPVSATITNPFVLSGLNASTEYQVRVKTTSCTNDNWSDAVSFTTKCDPITTFPWSEDFEGFTGSTVPTCWDNSASTSSTLSNYPERIWGVYEYSSNKMIRMYNYYVDNGTALINTPSIEMPTSGVYALTFDYAHNANCGDFIVKVSTNNGANFTDLASYSKGSGSSYTDPGDFTPATISLADYAGESIILQFFANANYGSGAIFVDNIKIIEEYHVDKTIEANKWYAISTPVHNNSNNETFDGVTNLTTGTYDLYRYDEATSTWVNSENDAFNYLEQGRGYIYRRSAATTLSFSGQINSGAINYDVTSTTDAGKLKGFNLVGNPYNHVIYKGVGLVGSNLATGYYALNGNGSWLVKTDNEEIAVGEAVLVLADAEGTINFADNQNAPNTSKGLSSTIALTVSNGENYDVTYAMFDNGTSLNKVAHLDENLPSLSILMNDGNYAIAMLDDETEQFDLAFNGADGNYTIKLDGSLINNSNIDYLHLIDRLTGADIDMLNDNAYSFNHSADNSMMSRFVVRLKATAQSASRFAFVNGNQIVVKGEGMLRVFDVMGRQLATINLDGSFHTFDRSGLGINATGVYLLHLNSQIQKIVVK